MKKILALTLLAITVSISVFAQQDIKFDAGSFNFGKIAQGTPVTHVFNFTNTGAKPVVVEYCTAECGCTTPEVTKEPILKGKSSTVKVTYNAASMGNFTKRVTVKLVGVAEPIILTISGEVVAPKK
jgi:hypothetical protein